MFTEFSFISDLELKTELDTIFQEGQEESKEGSVEPPNFEAEDEDDFLKWDDLNKNQPSVTTPNCGGLLMAEDNKIIAFVGADPDAKVNVWSYDPQKETYMINKKTIVKGFTQQKGSGLSCQFCPTLLKDINKVEDTCKYFKGTKFDGLTVRDGGAPLLALTTYKEIICHHLNKNSIWDVFQYVHPKTKKSLCLIQHLGKFQLSEVKLHIHQFCKTADKYALQNLDWSGFYLLNSISNSLYKEN